MKQPCMEDNCPCMYHKICYDETGNQGFGQLNIVYHFEASRAELQGRMSGLITFFPFLFPMVC